MLSPANAAEVRFLHSLLHPEGHFKKPTLCKYRAWRCSVMDCPGTYQRLLGATFNLRTHTHTLVRILFQTDTYELASRHGAAAGGQQGTIDSVAPASTCRVMVAEAVHDPVEQWTRQESWRRLETLMGSPNRAAKLLKSVRGGPVLQLFCTEAECRSGSFREFCHKSVQLRIIMRFTICPRDREPILEAPSSLSRFLYHRVHSN